MGIIITGLNAPRSPDTTNILTLFDVQLEGLMHLKGCALVQRPNQRVIWGPPRSTKEAGPCGVSFSKALRQAITEAASAAYDAFKAAPQTTTEISAAAALVRQIEERDAQ